MEHEHECCAHTKKRSADEVRALMNRLSRVEGQIRGIRGMIEKDAYCPDIITQIAAANAALSALGRELLSSHIRTCVVEGVRQGSEERVDELIQTLQKVLK